MKHLPVILAFALVAWAQAPKPSGAVSGGTGGGGGGGANATATSAPAVTSLAIDITALNASSVNQVIVQCWSGTAAPYNPVTITSLNPMSTTSVTANFTNTANVTCRANATGTGPAGAAGATGATGPAGANGTNGTNGAISQLQDEASNLTVRPTINFTGAGVTATDDAGNNRTNVTISGGGGGTYTAGTGLTLVADEFAINTAVTARKLDMQSGAPNYCRSTTGNDTYVCALTPTLTAYTRGGCVVLDPDTANTLTATIDVDTLGAKSILNRAGAALSTGDITANKPITICYDGTQYIVQGDGGGGGGSSTRITNQTFNVSAINSGGTGNFSDNFSALGTYGGITYVTPTFSGNTNPSRSYAIYPVAASGTNYTGALLTWILPTTWRSSADTKIKFIGSPASPGGDRTIEVATACIADGEDVGSTPTFNANQSVVINMATVNIQYSGEITLDMTGCAAGETIFIKVARPDTTAGNLFLRQVILIFTENLS